MVDQVSSAEEWLDWTMWHKLSLKNFKGKRKSNVSLLAQGECALSFSFSTPFLEIFSNIYTFPYVGTMNLNHWTMITKKRSKRLKNWKWSSNVFPRSAWLKQLNTSVYNPTFLSYTMNPCSWRYGPSILVIFNDPLRNFFSWFVLMNFSLDLYAGATGRNSNPAQHIQKQSP